MSEARRMEEERNRDRTKEKDMNALLMVHW